jgi:methionyl-tRNA formyltransferase
MKSLPHAKFNAVIFGHPYDIKSTLLSEAAIDLETNLNQFKVLAICDAGFQPAIHPLKKKILSLIKYGLIKLFNPGKPVFFNTSFLRSFRSIEKKHGVKIIVPPERNINHPDFIAYLRDELKPNLALSFGCSQIFSKELIGVFDICINNHNAILPDYRGWGTTEWSVYHGEEETGYTYHYLTEAIDEGPILDQGTVPIENHPILRLQYEKTRLAAQRMEKVIRAAAEGNPGTPQEGDSRYYRKRDLDAMTRIDEPSSIEWAELQHRLRSFGRLRLRLNGKQYVVTKLVRVKPGTTRKYTFVTADGITVAVVRFNNQLPLWMRNFL